MTTEARNAAAVAIYLLLQQKKEKEKFSVLP